jgi:putative protein kinase ArgK-like GTPase of G3E family
LQQVGAGTPAPVLLTSARDRTGFGELADALDAHRTQIGASGIAARRTDGRRAWAWRIFSALHGNHGVALLGGAEQVRQEIARALASGGSAPAVAADLSADFLRRVRH